MLQCSKECSKFQLRSPSGQSILSRVPTIESRNYVRARAKNTRAEESLALKRVHHSHISAGNLLGVIVSVVVVVVVFLQVVVEIGLFRVLVEGSVSRVSTNWSVT